jgi:hypothetical protein
MGNNGGLVYAGVSGASVFIFTNLNLNAAIANVNGGSVYLTGMN